MGWETQGQPVSCAVQGKNHSTAQVTHVPAPHVPLAADPKAIPVPSWHGAHCCEVGQACHAQAPFLIFLL